MKNKSIKQELVAFLEKRMEAGKGGATVRDIVRGTRKFGNSEEIEKLLLSATADGIVYSLNSIHDGPGRPSRKYFVTDTAAVKLRDAEDPAEAMQFNTTETDDEMTIGYFGEKWLSKDEIVAQLDLDMAIWRIDKVEYRGWEVTGKRHTGQHESDSGAITWGPQELWKSKNRYIALRLVRHAPKQIQDSIKDLLSRASWPVSPSPRRTAPGESVMELSVYDLHLGKYCWGKYTGESYDNDIASMVFKNAAHDLLEKASTHDIGRIVLPIGHDFFQVDNWVGETTAGTRVDSCDDRFSKTFQVGVDSFRYCIDKCLEVAPVELIYVPGNHDKSTSFYLTQVLQGYYHGNKNVEIDARISTGHNGRKYRKFGCTLLGYVHGAQRDCPKDRDLPLLMATERPQEWASTVDRAWRLGHLHTKRTSIVPVGDIFNGVRVERIPSLSATDVWHWDNGFTGNRRAAEAWIWSYEEGLVGQYPTYLFDYAGGN
jgi:hypothetical protein